MDDQDNKTGSGVQSPAPVAGRPLTDEDYKLLKRGDVLRVLALGSFWRHPLRVGQVVVVRSLDAGGNPVFEHEEAGMDIGWTGCTYAFIGRPDADGWMPWSGGENPAPGARVEVKLRNGRTYESYMSDEWAADPSDPTDHWHHKGDDYERQLDIIAFRLSRPASEQPVEAIGAGREEMAWHREDGLIYSLMQKGWRKGQPVMVNDVMIRVEACNGSETDIEPILQTILAALSPASPARTPMGGEVEALREALRLTRERVREWPLDDHETCMCGSPVEGHNIGSGHSPVSQADHAISLIVEGINEALAASSPSPAQGGITGQPVADAFIAGFMFAAGRQPWDDMHDFAAVCAVDYAAGKPLPDRAAPPSVQPVEGK